MRAAIVEREDVPALVHEKDRAMTAVHNKPALGFQLLKIAGADKIRNRGIHRRLIQEGSAAAPFSKGASRMSIQPPMYLFGCQSGERRGAQDQDEALVLISKSVAAARDWSGASPFPSRPPLFQDPMNVVPIQNLRTPLPGRLWHI
jgi:hypothetical protein